MSKIPCRKCNKCGVYHDLSVVVCEDCGTELKDIPALMIETDELTAEQYGEIKEEVPVFVQKCLVCGALNFTANKEAQIYQCHNCHELIVPMVDPVEYIPEETKLEDVTEETEQSATEKKFVQKCSVCGALNFTADKEKPVQRCYNCHKVRVASVKPVEYIPEEIKPEDATEETEQSATEKTDVSNKPVKILCNPDDEDNTSAYWQGIQGNIQKSVGGTEGLPKLTLEVNAEPTPATVDDDDDDDDDVVVGWSNILGGNALPKKEPIAKETPVAQKASVVQKGPAITLTAVRYGHLSFTLEAQPGLEYLLGRSANQSEFLNNDLRVGNEHCYLCYKNGSWYVRDNNSVNGTVVDSVDIGLNGEKKLNDGNKLKLGHHEDSMEFKVTIK